MAPTVQVKNLVRAPMEIFTDPAIIAVLSASLVAPFIVPHINALIETVPFLKDHKSIGAFLIGMVIFTFVAPIKMPVILRSIVLGIAGGFVLTSVLPLYDQITKQENQ